MKNNSIFESIKHIDEDGNEYWYARELQCVLDYKEWRKLNPEISNNSNMRDYATINELTVLSNLESHNALLIKENKTKEERFEILSEIANYQLNILNTADKVKKIELEK